MRLLILLPLAVTGATAAQENEVEAGRIDARAEAASVVIRPLPAGRRLISLPTLEFALTIESECAADTAAESISISIADTRMAFNAEEIAGNPVLETRLTLPGHQAGPLRIDDFCHIDGDAVTGTRLLQDLYTARLSLKCAGKNGSRTVYSTLPLDVSVSCNHPDQDDGASDSIARL